MITNNSTLKQLDPKKKKKHYSKITNKYFVLNYYDVYKKINLPSIPQPILA